jgi:hypothetical protein
MRRDGIKIRRRRRMALYEIRVFGDLFATTNRILSKFSNLFKKGEGIVMPWKRAPKRCALGRLFKD